MITVHTTHYISDHDIFDHFGTHYGDYTIFNECANDSFVFLNLSEEKLQELCEEIEYYQNKFEDNYIRQMKNEIDLINYLRSLGYTDSILVEICW